MRKVILAIGLCVALAGCQLPTLEGIKTAIQLGTASVTNPVTKTRLNEIESAVTIVFAGLNAWKSTCVQGLIPVSCRQQIAQVQVYTRQIPPYMEKLRGFVKTNDQVNATVVFNTVTDLIATVKTQAAAAGASIGS